MQPILGVMEDKIMQHLQKATYCMLTLSIRLWMVGSGEQKGGTHHSHQLSPNVANKLRIPIQYDSLRQSMDLHDMSEESPGN